VYVSDNGGPFTAFLTATTQTSATFHGVNGHKYAFFSVATDNVGNIQATPKAAQATTTLRIPPAPAVKKTTVTRSKGSIDAITVYFSEAITTASADNRKDYTLVDAGSSHFFGGKGNSKVTIRSMSYNASSHSVKLTLARPVSTGDSLRLTINAQPPSGIKGTNGQYLNETASGKPGPNAVIYLGAPRKKQVSATALVRRDTANYEMHRRAADERTQSPRGIPGGLPARRDWRAVSPRDSDATSPSRDHEKPYRARKATALAAIDLLLELEDYSTQGTRRALNEFGKDTDWGRMPTATGPGRPDGRRRNTEDDRNRRTRR
jgi:hypothetical protein